MPEVISHGLTWYWLQEQDMYEHSYQMDFGAATARYVDAFFANIQWDAARSRLELRLKSTTA